jgi:hypothetical protein
MTNDTSTPEKERDFWGAFKNFAIVFSFIVNLILVLVLLISPAPALMAKGQIVDPLLGNLDAAFAALGDTVINSTVKVDHMLPVQFDLPLKQGTKVVLTEPVPLQAKATFFLPDGGGAINGTVSLNLPEGMALPVNLDLMVPVSSTIPVLIDVPVEIPLDKAGMGPAIKKLRDVFHPLIEFLQTIPNTPAEALGLKADQDSQNP